MSVHTMNLIWLSAFRQ